jgi:nitrite reductase/ring-hydroxylating ferredoxin subunit
MSEFIKVGKKKDFSDKTGTGIEINGRRLCISRLGNDFYAMDDRCSHAESLLSGGDIEEGEISCPLHGARFSVKTGEAMSLPAVKPVQTHEVKIQGEDVFVKLKEETKA